MSVSQESLVDRIYEAALFPDGWTAVLRDIEELVDGTGAGLLTRRSDAWTGWKASPSGLALQARYFASGAAATSDTTRALVAANRAGFVPDHDLMSEEAYLKDPVVTNFATPAGLYRGAATAISIPGGDSAVIQLWRQAGRPRFEREDIAQLDALRPHLARATMLASRLRLERLRAQTQALELLGLPAAVLDARGRVLAANDLLQSIQTHIAWLPGDRLTLRDKSAATILRQATELNTSSRAPSGRSFAARGPDEADPIVLHIVPLKGLGQDLFDGGLHLLAVNRLGEQAPGSAVLQGLFDLTASEARVAAGLLEGMTAAELSLRHGVSLATIRTQVRGLLNKSGMDRQAEFIAKLRGVSVGR